MATPAPNTMGNSTNIADLIERVLDKGVVIAGDIQVKLLDIELLTLQIRVVICSIDKAQEMGLDWWANKPISTQSDRRILELEQRLASLEAANPDPIATTPAGEKARP